MFASQKIIKPVPYLVSSHYLRQKFEQFDWDRRLQEEFDNSLQESSQTDVQLKKKLRSSYYDDLFKQKQIWPQDLSLSKCSLVAITTFSSLINLPDSKIREFSELISYSTTDSNGQSHMVQYPLLELPVPGRQPLSVEEFDSVHTTYWPLATRPTSKDTITFSNKDKDDICRFFSIALQHASRSRSLGFSFRAAVVVDPAISKVIAGAGDESNILSSQEDSLSRPNSTQPILDHSTVYDSKFLSPTSCPSLHPPQRIDPDLSSKPRESAATVTPYSVSRDTSGPSLYCSRPLMHPVMNVIDRVAWVHRSMFSCFSYQDGVSPKSLLMSKTGESDEKVLQPDGIQNEVPYLCTGYDLYVTHEPCMMCAMAALHSRFRRIFFLHRSSVHGGLGSLEALHFNNYVNHRYNVFQVSFSSSSSSE